MKYTSWLAWNTVAGGASAANTTPSELIAVTCTLPVSSETLRSTCMLDPALQSEQLVAKSLCSAAALSQAFKHSHPNPVTRQSPAQHTVLLDRRQRVSACCRKGLLQRRKTGSLPEW